MNEYQELQSMNTSNQISKAIILKKFKKCICLLFLYCIKNSFILLCREKTLKAIFTLFQIRMMWFIGMTLPLLLHPWALFIILPRGLLLVIYRVLITASYMKRLGGIFVGETWSEYVIFNLQVL